MSRSQSTSPLRSNSIETKKPQDEWGVHGREASRAERAQTDLDSGASEAVGPVNPRPGSQQLLRPRRVPVGRSRGQELLQTHRPSVANPPVFQGAAAAVTARALKQVVRVWGEQLRTKMETRRKTWEAGGWLLARPLIVARPEWRVASPAAHSRVRARMCALLNEWRVTSVARRQQLWTDGLVVCRLFA